MRSSITGKEAPALQVEDYKETIEVERGSRTKRIKSTEEYNRSKDLKRARTGKGYLG